MIGHRFGQDESSGQNPAAILNGFAFRVYLMFSKICKNTTYWQILTNIGHRFGHQSGQEESSGQNPAAILNNLSFRVYLVVSEICKNTKCLSKSNIIESKHNHININITNCLDLEDSQAFRSVRIDPSRQVSIEEPIITPYAPLRIWNGAKTIENLENLVKSAGGIILY